MALTRTAYYANPISRRAGLRPELHDPIARRLLSALEGGPRTLAYLASTGSERRVLRRLLQCELVTGYRLASVTRYRLRRGGPHVRALIAEAEAAARRADCA